MAYAGRTERERRIQLTDISAGQPVYDGGDNQLGSVRGVDDAGFYVLAGEGAGAVTLDEARDIFGKAYVMWRCWECGEMDQIDGDPPANCPSCDASREELYYWAEDWLRRRADRRPTDRTALFVA